MRLCHQGCRRDRELPFFFEGRPPSLGGQRKGEPHAANPLLKHSFDEDVHSNDDLIHEIENYTEGAEGDAQVQLLDSPQLTFLPHALSSICASTSTGNAGPLTSGAASQDVSPCYVCED